MDRIDLAIIGGGPIGLEAASMAAARGLSFMLWEKGREIADNIRRWGHVRLFSPFQMNHSSWSRKLFQQEAPGHELPVNDAFLTGHDYRSQYLVPLAKLPSLQERIRTGVEVREIAKKGVSKRDQIGNTSRLRHNFLLRLSQGDHEWLRQARFVIDASGVYSNPLPFGAGNLQLPGETRFRERISRQLPDLRGNESFLARRRILLVGSGFSAATVLEQRLDSSPTQRGKVWWIYRSWASAPYPEIQNDPLPYRASLGQMANELAENPPDWLEVCLGSEVVGLEEANSGMIEVTLDSSGRKRRFRVDNVISAVGFQPDRRLYNQLQVHECYATQGPITLAASLLGGSTDCLDQISPGIELLRNPEPGFYILGNKSYGTNNTFLIKNGLDQVESVIEDIVELLTTVSSQVAGATCL